MFTAPDLSKKTLRVAAFDYSFNQWTDTEASAIGRYGEHSSMSMEIRYQTVWAHKSKFIDTLLHEINHAVFWVYGIETDDKEERLTATYATAWTQIYRDNPWLLTLIKETLS